MCYFPPMVWKAGKHINNMSKKEVDVRLIENNYVSSHDEQKGWVSIQYYSLNCHNRSTLRRKQYNLISFTMILK